MDVNIDKKAFRKENVFEMTHWTLDQKIEHAKKRIVEFYETMDGKVYVAFSGGKDSTVLLHLVRSIYPNVVAVFCNTTNEFLEILEFIKSTENVITVMPKMTFNQTVEKYGFPLVSKNVARAVSTLKSNSPRSEKSRNLYLTGVTSSGKTSTRFKLAKKWYPLFEKAKFDITSKCCHILKHEPSERFQRESGLKPYVGTMVDEGSERKINWIEHGCNILKDGKGVKSRPLSIWTEKDIWDYIKKYNVPYAKIYDKTKSKTGALIQGEKRTGCAYCGFGCDLESTKTHNRYQRLKMRKPKQFEMMMNLKNNGVTFSEALDFIHIPH